MAGPCWWRGHAQSLICVSRAEAEYVEGRVAGYLPSKAACFWLSEVISSTLMTQQSTRKIRRRFHAAILSIEYCRTGEKDLCTELRNQYLHLGCGQQTEYNKKY